MDYNLKTATKIISKRCCESSFPKRKENSFVGTGDVVDMNSGNRNSGMCTEGVAFIMTTTNPLFIVTRVPLHTRKSILTVGGLQNADVCSITS